MLCTDANSGLSHGAIEELCTWCSARIQAVRFQSSPRLITAVSTLPAEIGRDGKYPQNTFFTFPPAVFNLSYEPVLNCFHVNLTLFLYFKKAVWHVELKHSCGFTFKKLLFASSGHQSACFCSCSGFYKVEMGRKLHLPLFSFFSFSV